MSWWPFYKKLFQRLRMQASSQNFRHRSCWLAFVPFFPSSTTSLMLLLNNTDQPSWLADGPHQHPINVVDQTGQPECTWASQPVWLFKWASQPVWVFRWARQPANDFFIGFAGLLGHIQRIFLVFFWNVLFNLLYCFGGWSVHPWSGNFQYFIRYIFRLFISMQHFHDVFHWFVYIERMSFHLFASIGRPFLNLKKSTIGC